MSNEEEKKVIDFWKKNRIYEKSVKKNKNGKKFYMMDGPPYATGHIHMGTALNKILKDIAMRSRRIQGFDVFDRPGYDTHGVPIELQVEKEIGSKGKQDIEKFGVKNFVEKCREYATKYIGVMNKEFENLGVWMNWENPYLTLSDDYVETIWGAFKEAEKKGLLYLGKYSVHVCTRCGTAVAYNEIEYGKQKDTSVFVKFPLKDKKNTFLVIWTTTPWTLPGNTGVMVNPEVDYQEVEVSEGEKWIIAKELVPKLMEKLERGFTIRDEYKGKKMDGWKYENPLAKNLRMNLKNAYKVVLSARYVTTEEGTGLVHCAPGHGKEDYEVGKENGLDSPCPVAINGELTEEAGKYKGKKAREVDKEIIEDLEKDGFLVYKMQFEHEYPLCWRDKTPLLMLAQPQWFLKISEIQKELLKKNEKVNWNPNYMKLRMKAWLEGIGDWPVSRQRYWGTPLPIWHDEETGERIVVGSIDELKKLSGVKKINVHKPEIDEVVIKSKSGKILKRVPEVLDVWFDSGVSSWAALDKKEFSNFWPADLNIEGKDQFRGWWNSQIILSEIAFGKVPFESISVHGMILDIGKKKMSKSLGNIVSPEEIIEKYGRDFLRYYFAKLSKGEDFSFDEKEISKIQRVFMTLGNLIRFSEQLKEKKGKKEIEDKWILSKFNSLLGDVAVAYKEYKFPEVTRLLEDFIINDLSRNYIQIIRERADEVKVALLDMLVGILKMLAPICPFVTERIWQEFRKNKIVKEESIHLSEFPKSDKKKTDKKLENEFNSAFMIIESGLAERDKAKIGLRWPLAKANIESPVKLNKELEKIIARQLNVKKVESKKGEEVKVELDLKTTPELEAEGYAREISRQIQAERKKAGFKKEDLVGVRVYCDVELKSIIEKHAESIKERTNSKKVEIIEGKLPEKCDVFTAKEKKFCIKFS